MFNKALTALTVMFVLAGSTPASACPNCKNALPDTEDGISITRLRDGYFWSYIGMSSMPFLAVGTIGTALYRRIKQANKDNGQ